MRPHPEETSRRLWADHPFAPVDLAAPATGQLTAFTVYNIQRG